MYTEIQIIVRMSNFIKSPFSSVEPHPILWYLIKTIYIIEVLKEKGIEEEESLANTVYWSDKIITLSHQY